ncbi:MAG: carboxypeptidase-like regulatory domain-containing protein [Planctomycetaceae bacterium]|jgi:hypothetical protein|nr:carboxypeptidase-like regulatory domain-containing protein [Planctomycetaceae bacterium]
MKHCITLTLLLLFAAGCSGRVGVSGKVSYDDGQPVEGCSVLFRSAGENYQGIADEKGKYQLGSGGNTNGIRPGIYQVTVASTYNDENENTVYKVSPKYAETGTSGLTCEVKGKTVFDIKVEHAGEAEQPPKYNRKPPRRDEN